MQKISKLKVQIGSIYLTTNKTTELYCQRVGHIAVFSLKKIYITKTKGNILKINNI